MAMIVGGSWAAAIELTRQSDEDIEVNLRPAMIFFMAPGIRFMVN